MISVPFIYWCLHFIPLFKIDKAYHKELDIISQVMYIIISKFGPKHGAANIN